MQSRVAKVLESLSVTVAAVALTACGMGGNEGPQTDATCDGAACAYDGGTRDTGTHQAMDSAVDANATCAPGPSVAPGTTNADPIYPAPRFITTGPLGARVHTVCVDTSALASHAALDRLVGETVRESGLTVAPMDDCSCDYSIRFTANAPTLQTDAASAWTAAGTSPDRYIVSTSTDSGRASASLFAGSERAGLYALRAALALAQSDPDDTTARRIGTAVIVDYPTVAYRGFVEGIYGCEGTLNAPYTPRERATFIRLMSRLRLNVYIYSPKCDPYARSSWQDAYPEDGEGDAQAIQTALHEANADLVDFVWAISPGGSYDFSTSAFNALTHKLDLMHAMGVQHFALFLDDIPTSNVNPVSQGDLVSQIEDYVRMHYGANEHLITVGSKYAGVFSGWSTYNQTFAAHIGHREVEVMWTGNQIVSDTISSGDLSGINSALGRHASIWDNYPATPGAWTGRSADLGDAVTGFYMNPILSEPWSNRPSPGYYPVEDTYKLLGPLGDYLWSPAHFVNGPNDSPSSSFAHWSNEVTGVVNTVAACDPCTNEATGAQIWGWTCDPHDGPDTIYYCDPHTHCRVTLPCPGGCVLEASGVPDQCH